MAHPTIPLRGFFTIVLWLVAVCAVAAEPGEAVYHGTCIACHGAKGKGTLPGVPDLTDPKGVLNKSDDELMKNIINGLRSPGSPLAMPPKGGDSTLDRDDIAAVIRYMRETFDSR